MLSADKELVVIHDTTLERTTNGSGKVTDLPYAALREFDAGGKFGAAFPGERIPTLAQVFEALGGKFLINVELKNYHSPSDDLTERVIALIQKFALGETILLSSFNVRNLFRAKRADPAIKSGLLTLPGLVGLPYRSCLGRLFPYDALHPHHSNVTARLVKACHARNKQVNTWTVDDPGELRRARSLGVDMVICNDPAAARAALQSE